MSEDKRQPDTLLGFQDVLPHIATLYRRSLLVPYIGSGMSFPACTSWKEFQRRLADETVSALRPMPHELRATKYRNALPACDPAQTVARPAQSRALAESYWSLILTTNYDDLYWSAASSRWRSSPIVLGRSWSAYQHYGNPYLRFFDAETLKNE
jgi:hypothetical protein